MWLLIVFTLTLAGEPSIDVFPAKSRTACYELSAQATAMLGSGGGNLKAFYVECKPYKVS